MLSASAGWTRALDRKMQSRSLLAMTRRSKADDRTVSLCALDLATGEHYIARVKTASFLFVMLFVASAEQPSAEVRCVVVRCSSWYAEKNCQQIIEITQQSWASGKRVQRKKGFLKIEGKFEHVAASFDTGKKAYSWSDLDLLSSSGVRVTILNPKTRSAKSDEAAAAETCKKLSVPIK